LGVGGTGTDGTGEEASGRGVRGVWNFLARWKGRAEYQLPPALFDLSLH
jgi:hypothetical protein